MRFFLHKLQAANTTENFIYYNKKKNEFYAYIMIIQLKIFVCQMPEKLPMFHYGHMYQNFATLKYRYSWSWKLSLVPDTWHHFSQTQKALNMIAPCI